MAEVQFGVHVPNAGPMASPENLVCLARRAEELGYDSIWVSDHIIAPEGFASVYPYGSNPPLSTPGAEIYYEPLTTLAYLAGATQQIRLGISVLVVPMRNPVYTAKIIATLDALSGGRVILGVGAGWLREEFEALGQDGAGFVQRGRKTDEWIAIYRTLWSDETVVSFEGEFYSLPPVRSFPKPVQRPVQYASAQSRYWPGPPIWVGGNTKAALRRVARLGDGWQGLRLSAEEIRTSMQQIRELLAEVGRPPEEIVLSTRGNAGLQPARPDDADWEFVGDPRTAAERARRYVEAGSQHISLSFQPRESLAGQLESMEWFATEVRPLMG